jgi:RNA polymerase sigma-54 factor
MSAHPITPPRQGSVLEFRIVDRFLEDLGKRRFPEIARRLGTTPEQVQRAANFVATLDPKPGQIFTPDPNNYVLPDVTVERIGGRGKSASTVIKFRIYGSATPTRI